MVVYIWKSLEEVNIHDQVGAILLEDVHICNPQLVANPSRLAFWVNILAPFLQFKNKF